MRTAFIIGNGISRKSINLNKLKQYGATFGCNALYRDFLPDTLIVINKEMLKEVEEAKISKQVKILTKDCDKRVKLCSGASAAYVALEEGFDRLYLLGMDLWVDNRNHNIYMDTLNYATSEYAKGEEQYGKQQAWWNTVIKKFSNIDFIRVTPEKYVKPFCFKDIKHIDIKTFKEQFNGS